MVRYWPPLPFVWLLLIEFDDVCGDKKKQVEMTLEDEVYLKF